MATAVEELNFAFHLTYILFYLNSCMWLVAAVLNSAGQNSLFFWSKGSHFWGVVLVINYCLVTSQFLGSGIWQ